MSNRVDAGHGSTKTWRKSSRSANNAHCVEVAVAEQAVAVRDTKDRAGGALSFSRSRWDAFLAAL